MLRLSAVIGTAIMAAVLVIGCDPPSEPRIATTQIRLSADVSGTPIDVLVVTVTAVDITSPLIFNIPVQNQVAQGTIRVPPGAARTIDVQAFDALGNVLFEGSKTIDVSPGQNPPVKIPMVAKGGQVTIMVTLGPVSVVVAPPSASLAVGATQQLTATITAADGELLSGPADWATTNPALATVDPSGLVTALRSGTVDIVATFAGVAGVSHLAVLSSSTPTVWAPDPQAPVASGTFGYVWASSSNNIFVVSQVGRPMVNLWNGSQWVVVGALPAEVATLGHIWGTGPTSVYAAATTISGGGELLHFDGFTWSVVAATPQAPLRGVWGPSDASLWTVGQSDSIFHLTNAGLAVAFMGNGFLRSVWGLDDNSVFAVGLAGTIEHWNGSTWSVMQSGTTETLFGVWGTSPTNVFATGDHGIILHFDGSQWSTVVAGAASYLAGISGTAPDNIVAVGGGGTILHFDGTSWSPMVSGTTDDLIGVWALSSTDFIVTGGTMLRSH